jgi:HTH-type transcriptional regulator/antitoxin HigA
MAVEVVRTAGRSKGRKAVRTRPTAAKKGAHPPSRRKAASASYLALAKAFPIRPLRSDTELDEAIAVLNSLLSRKKPLDDQEQGYLEALGHEIQRYEDEAVPMPEVSGAEMLRHLIDARGVTLSAVADATGIAISTLSQIRDGRRKLNVNHIARLAPYFGVEPGVFLD